MKIKQYQEEAINELHEKTKKLLIYKGTKKIVFEAPTGSGKTFIVSQFISRLVKDSSVGIPISFVWTAPLS